MSDPQRITLADLAHDGWNDLVYAFMERMPEPCTVGVIWWLRALGLVPEDLPRGGYLWRVLNLDRRDGETWDVRWQNVIAMTAAVPPANIVFWDSTNPDEALTSWGAFATVQGWRPDGTGHTLVFYVLPGGALHVVHTDATYGPQAVIRASLADLMTYFNFDRIGIALWWPREVEDPSEAPAPVRTASAAQEAESRSERARSAAPTPAKEAPVKTYPPEIAEYLERMKDANLLPAPSRKLDKGPSWSVIWPAIRDIVRIVEELAGSRPGRERKAIAVAMLNEAIDIPLLGEPAEAAVLGALIDLAVALMQGR